MSFLLAEQGGDVSVPAENTDDNELTVPYPVKDLIVAYRKAANAGCYLRSFPPHLRRFGEQPTLIPEQVDETVGGVLIVLRDIVPDVVQILCGLTREFKFHRRVTYCGLSAFAGLFS